MTIFVLFTIFVFACGLILGAAWFGPARFRRRPKPIALPYVAVYSPGEWRKLDLPPARRHQHIPIERVP